MTAPLRENISLKKYAVLERVQQEYVPYLNPYFCFAKNIRQVKMVASSR